MLVEILPCEKIKYESKVSAINAAANIMRTYRTSNTVETKQLRAYYCQYCNFWHLTSQYIKRESGPA
jgi:hypothetical protein